MVWQTWPSCKSGKGSSTDENRAGWPARDIRLVDCVFNNCSGVGGKATKIELSNSSVWSSFLYDVVLEDCDIDGRGWRCRARVPAL